MSAIALLAIAACNKSNAHEGHDHASHQATEQHPGEAHAQPAAATSQAIIPISASDKGFQPSRVELKKGQSATLRFTRTSDTTCATKVVFPELKIEKDLPLNEAVDIEVPTGEPRELAFQCGMGMYKSAVVIN
jgi:plastocyanin domain-containing protein